MWWTAAAEAAAQARSTYRRAKHYRAVAKHTAATTSSVLHAPQDVTDWAAGERSRMPRWLVVLLVILIAGYPGWLVGHVVSETRVLPLPFGPTWGDVVGVSPIACTPTAPGAGGPGVVQARWPSMPWQDEPEDERPWWTTVTGAFGTVLRTEAADPDNLVEYGRWWHGIISSGVGAAADGFLQSDVASPSVREYDARYAARVESSCGVPCAPGTGSGDGPDLARAAAAAAGFTGRDLTIAVAVAGAESTWRPDAANPTSNARGMWQIMTTAHPEKLAGRDVLDPYDNAAAAFEVWQEAGGWSPWVAYTSGAYEQHLPAAEAATGSSGCESPQGGVSAAGYGNGRIPPSALCELRSAPGESADCAAAAAFDRMSAAYAATFGVPIQVTDSYRDYDAQVRLRAAKPSLAAVPGTSNHGVGLAFDLGGGIQSFGTPQHEWMRGNAGRFGFSHPSWAQQGGSKPEAWHWEFTGGGSAPAG